ncbi:MAG: Fe-S cluster assembly ATPase SufC [Actinomycetota bacterium]|jgi:Fe-S cluster assembly ATP-binding protein|nr:Fe-S cluster assembly ATPase SufC [Actinomycetota bacterium]
MSDLVVEGLHASVAGREILRGVDLRVGGGEVHALMGPNGSGKSTLSHVLAGRPGYEVTAGSVRLDGVELLGLPAWERAQAGLFLALQYPIEVPGVSVYDALGESMEAAGRERGRVRELVGAEARRIGLDEALLTRALNVDLSGGERKRNEILQLAVLQPKVAVLDEIDSGLDIDALTAVARRVAQLAAESGTGVLAITHYQRLLSELAADKVHVLSAGRVVQTGGPELALELERTGYAAYGGEQEEPGEPAVARRPRPLV